MSWKASILGAVVLATGSLLAGQAQAVLTPVPPGWVVDEADNVGAPPTLNSPIAVTILPGETGYFSLVDCCIAGDVYEIWNGASDGGGTLLGTSGLGLLAAMWSTPTNDTSADDAWVDPALTRAIVTLAPGSYSLYVYDVSDTGAPDQFSAGLWERLDIDAPLVPEPATLTILGTALMGLGATVRRRRSK